MTVSGYREQDLLAKMMLMLMNSSIFELHSVSANRFKATKKE
jgi:hypothetical protein